MLNVLSVVCKLDGPEYNIPIEMSLTMLIGSITSSNRSGLSMRTRIYEGLERLCFRSDPFANLSVDCQATIIDTQGENATKRSVCKHQ